MYMVVTWYIVYIPNRRDVHGTLYIYPTEGMYMVHGIYTQPEGCTWYIVYIPNRRDVYGQWQMDKVN